MHQADPSQSGSCDDKPMVDSSPPMPQHRAPNRLWNWPRPDVASAVATVVMAIFTGALFYTSFGQWEAIKGQLAIMEAAERPWVRVNGPTTTRDFEGDKFLWINIKVSNPGKSPARILETLVGAGSFAALPDSPPYGEIPHDKRSKLVLFPTMEVPVDFEMFLPKAKLAAIQKGALKLFVYARVTYEDMRDHSQHETTFCAYYSLETRNYRYCDGYNSAT